MGNLPPNHLTTLGTNLETLVTRKSTTRRALRHRLDSKKETAPMTDHIDTEGPVALMLAHAILQENFSAGEHPITEEDVIQGRIVDNMKDSPVFPAIVAHVPRLDEYTFTYNATYLPSCCAGECAIHHPEAIGYVDITVPSGRTYMFSLDVIMYYEWNMP